MVFNVVLSLEKLCFGNSLIGTIFKEFKHRNRDEL